ncbi:hypothetical protein [Streptomyces sp. NPDC001978]|uniref:hypothetical protein n=1 Tax=Streptomyces sp. NPDC001978 TaxID=3364627 RepID=UPI0036765B47
MIAAIAKRADLIPMKNRDFLGALALLAALVATASAEFQLARACGYGAIVAGCIPGALDIYALRAFSVKRDVPAVVTALVLTNALAHLVSAGLIPVSVPLVVAVSAIAPLALYRVKALAAPVSAPQPAPVTAPAPALERPVERPVAVPAPAPAGAPAVQPATAADELLPKARAFAAEVRSATGKAPSLRALQAHLSIGQARAQRIRAALAT